MSVEASIGSVQSGAAMGEAFVERRQEPRTPTNWIAMILLPDGGEVPCTVKDVSRSGAKLGVPDAVALPEDFQLRVLGYDFLFRVRLVWRRDGCTGVRIERFGKNPPPPPPSPEPPKEPEHESYTALGRRKSRYSSI